MQVEQGIPSFESGKICLTSGDVKVLAVNLTSTHITINIEDKAFIKRVIALRNEFIPKPQAAEEHKPPNLGGTLSTVRSVAETLRSRGVTIAIFYKSHRIATIGADAKPTLLHHITKTRGVALNSFYTAIKMII